MKKIFTALNWIAGIVFVLSGCAVEEATWTQIMVCGISGVYLCCAYYISEALKKRKKALHKM